MDDLMKRPEFGRRHPPCAQLRTGAGDRVFQRPELQQRARGVLDSPPSRGMTVKVAPDERSDIRGRCQTELAVPHRATLMQATTVEAFSRRVVDGPKYTPADIHESW